MERLQGEGVRGADLVFACIGPALEIFSRYTKVETAEGQEITLAEYLEKVWEVVGRTALEQVLGSGEARARNGAAGALEEDARLTALFLWTLQRTNGEGHDSAADSDADEPEDLDEDAEEEGPRGKPKGFSLVFDVVRRFAQPLGIHLPAWEGRIIKTMGAVHVFVNRCAHRGVKFCRVPSGHVQHFTCPYHQWTYDLQGRLRGVPFHRGLKHQGGMPADFSRAAYGLETLQVTVRHGAVFASFSAHVEPFADYLGPTMLTYFDRVFNGRPLRLLGYMRQRIPSNWKLIFENIKDPYHASLMHVFLVTFGLFRADQPSAVYMDATGRHACLISRRGEQRATSDTADMHNLREDFTLHDPRLLAPVREFPGDVTVVLQTLWPNLIIQQQSNTLAMRQIVPRGPGAFELLWTFFGYADDTEEMTLKRLRQANLMGPAGLVSADDSEVMKLSQDGIAPYAEAAGVIEMGGRDIENTEHMVTEVAIRAFYRYYREVMGF